jgi:hypothetical protein
MSLAAERSSPAKFASDNFKPTNAYLALFSVTSSITCESKSINLK